MGTTRYLERQWSDLWLRTGAQHDPSPLFLDLKQRYAEPQRKYHRIPHIEHGVRAFSDVRLLAKHPDAILFAFFLHDAVYDPTRKDNEERSTELAWAMIEQAELPVPFGELVEHLIMATKRHGTSADIDVQIMIDMDLCILGADAAVFDVYERQIRREYKHVPDDIFIPNRIRFLERMLERGAIFSTDHFRNQCQAAAEENIKRSIRHLRMLRHV